MINRQLTDLYLDYFDSLNEAIYLCWNNSFCHKTKTLDKFKLREQIRTYGLYNHKNATKKEAAHSFKNKLQFKSLLWVNKYINAVNENTLCEHIELYEQAVKEVENNLFLLNNKDDKIAYANLILRDLDKKGIYSQCAVESNCHINYKEVFEYVLDSKFIFENSVNQSNVEYSAIYPNYDLTVRLINHFDFMDRLIELFLCFGINIILIAEKTKYHLYLFNDSIIDNLSCAEFKEISNNVNFENDKCQSCNNLYCEKSDYQKSGSFTNNNHVFNENTHNSQQEITQKFNSTLSDDCLIKIMRYLASKKKIENPNSDVWLFWFNRKCIKVHEPLKWRGTPSMLSNVIQHICGESISSTIKTAFSTKEYIKPTKSKYEHSRMHKEIEQIITISKQKNN